MVNEKILIRDRWRGARKISKVLIVLIFIVIILIGVFLVGFFIKPKIRIVLENPLKNIVFANTNEAGEVNYAAVLSQGVIEFNADYINFILFALGANNLHKSYVGYGNPVIEFVLEDESWNAELDKGRLKTQIGMIEKKDLRISILKEEAVKALLSSDIKQFMKDSVANGNTQIEMIAGNVELGSKGYLSMYKELTGKEIEVE